MQLSFCCPFFCEISEMTRARRLAVGATLPPPLEIMCTHSVVRVAARETTRVRKDEKEELSVASAAATSGVERRTPGRQRTALAYLLHGGSATQIMAEEPTYHRQPKITATPVPSDFPQLLDDSQWTQAATFSQDDKYAGPSERIGRYYRQRLEELDRSGLEQKRMERTAPPSPLRPTIERKGWAAGLPCRPLLAPVDVSDTGGASSSSDLSSSALGILQRQRDAEEQLKATPYTGTRRNAHITDQDALQDRVAKYVRDGIDESCLAPFNDAWMESAMEQVPIELNGVAPEDVGDMLESMQEEVHDAYFDAVKLSMVDYVMKSNVEGSRLEITQPIAKFELNIFHPSQDPSVAECAMPKVC